MDSQSKTSLDYVLFLYREQLRQRKIQSATRLNCTKISLTDKLIKKTARNMDKCTIEDMLAINRGIEFKKKLKYQIQRMHQMRKLAQTQGAKNVQKK